VLNRVLRHNLRASVNVITGQTGLLEDRVREAIGTDALPAAIEDSLQTVRDRVEHLHSQAETAREIETVLADDPGEQTWESVETLCETATETAADFEASCVCDVDGEIDDRRVDSEVTRIVEELVENAISHHDRQPSAVKVRVTLSVAGDDLLLTVADDGPGLSEQELVVIEDGAEEPLRHGSGLGLWMVNWLAIACGGSISATTGDSGTTINVRVPLRGAAESTPSDPPVDPDWMADGS
jgi:signal transduction histidine kinase